MSFSFRRFSTPTLSASALALSLGLSPLACTDDGADDEEIGDASSNGSNGDETPADDTMGEDTTESSSGDTTEEDSSSEDTTEEDSSSEDTTESSSEDTTEEDSSSEDTGPVDNAGYDAIALPGVLNRIILTRKDFNENSCTEMVLRSPVMFDDFDIEIPDLWRIEEVRGWNGGTECPEDKGNPDFGAGGGTGSITFLGYDALALYPCAISFDMELFYSTEPPTSKFWNKDNIEIMGVNCG